MGFLPMTSRLLSRCSASLAKEACGQRCIARFPRGARAGRLRGACARVCPLRATACLVEALAIDFVSVEVLLRAQVCVGASRVRVPLANKGVELASSRPRSFHVAIVK